MLCYAVSVSVYVYLSTRLSEVPLPLLMTWRWLWTSYTITIIIVIILVIPPLYSCREYSNNSSLTLVASKTRSSCSWRMGWILRERLLKQVFKCKNRKEKEQGWKITHHPSAFMEGVDHDICITANKAFPRKVVKAVSIDRPRQARRINNSTSSRAFLTQVFHLSVTSVQECRWWLIKGK